MWYSRQINLNIIAIIVFNCVALIPAYAAGDMVHEVDELAYGVALYDFYQDKYFSAISDILVAKKTQTIVDQNKNSELLLGSLYSTYGMQDRGREIFKNITLDARKNINISHAVLDQVRFHTGKDYYNDGQEEKARQALLSINSNHRTTLDPEYEAERLNMLAEIYLHDHQYDDVMQLLELFPQDSSAFFPEESIWKRYTQFNLGISLIKNDRPDEGLLLLENIAELPSSNKEIDLLRDQANLALAASYTKSGKLDLAIKHFENIKLGSSQSNSALLGLGWVKYRMSSYRDALGTWLELSRRSRSEANVQEALMLMPYVLEKRGEKARALTQYDFAVETYQQELKNVEKVKALIKQGEVIRKLKLSASQEGRLDSYNMTQAMGPELSDYLSGLISSRDFIQAVNGYRDLTVLSNNLSQWLQTIPALNLVLDEKINTYNHHLSTAINSLKFESAKKLQDRRTEFVEQLEKALTSNSTTILLNKEEKEIIGRLNKLESGLKKLNANDAEVMAMKDKHHFLSGILQWNISTDYAPRLWAVKTSIAELDRALQRVNHTIQLLTTVWEAAPATHQRFRDQLKGKKERIKTLMSNIEQVMSVQEQNIQLMAEAAINQYRDDLKPYHDRALFARARLYDSMVRKN